LQALAKVATTIDKLNTRIGRTIAWLALFMILVQFVVVVMRYVFGIGSIFMQESIIYMHGLMFMIGAGFTLLNDGHVRVDIFYGDAQPRTKALINLLGSILFLIPFCIIVFWVSYPYVANAWAVFEGSPETSGIQAVFLLKSVILVFCVLMALQGVSLAIHSLFVLKGLERPGHRDPAATEL
jgi:TRAP-type mannitol/chloroaromatic compound transport system permease small subunit